MTKTKSQVYRERNMYAASVAVMAASVDGFDSGYHSRRDRLNYLIELVENGVSETQSSD